MLTNDPKINHYWSEEFQKALDKENARVGREWELSKDDPLIIAERQGLRFKKLFERFECDD